jgi:hypothetical protein
MDGLSGELLNAVIPRRSRWYGAWARASRMPPNMRLKLTAPVLERRIAFVIRTARRRSLGAFR